MKSWIIASAGVAMIAVSSLSAQADGVHLGDFDSSGPYLGILFGLSQQYHLQQVVTEIGPPSQEQDLGYARAQFALRAGWDTELSNQLLAGVFAEASYSAGESDFYFNDRSGTASTKQNGAFAIGARFGIATNENQRWFVNGGLSAAYYTEDIVLPFRTFEPSSQFLTGAFGGVEVETHISRELSVLMQFRATDYEREALTASPSGAGLQSWTLEPQELMTSLGLIYRPGSASNLAQDESSAFSTGAFIGFGGGFAGFAAEPVRAAPYDKQDLSENGLRGYVQAGFDVVLPEHPLVGAFVDYAVGDLAATDPGRAEITESENLSVGLRAGRIFGDALLYGSLGYTWADLTIINGDNLSMSLTPTHDRSGGWFAGVGVESALTDSLSIKLDYMISNLSDVSSVTPGYPDLRVQDIIAQTTRIGIAYRF